MVTVLGGTGIGVLIGSRIRERFRTIAFVALGLTTFLIGLQMALKTQQVLVPMLSLLVGGLLGEALAIEERIQTLGNRFTGGKGAEGFVAASLLFCVGSMTVLGALEEGIQGTFKIYTIKALLDGVASIAFASAMGWGVGLAALSVLVIQGGLTLLAAQAQPWLTPALLNGLTGTGGLILVSLALGMLEIKKLPVANLLPALLLAPFFCLMLGKLPL